MRHSENKIHRCGIPTISALLNGARSKSQGSPICQNNSVFMDLDNNRRNRQTEIRFEIGNAERLRMPSSIRRESKQCNPNAHMLMKPMVMLGSQVAILQLKRI